MTGWENLHLAPGCARGHRSLSLAAGRLTSQPRPVTIEGRVMPVASGSKLAEQQFDLTEHRFEATTSSGDVSALLMRPLDADCLLVLAHGAGAGMRHPFMEAVAARLADRRIATFRYQFPYIEHGRRRPDYQPVLLKTVRSAASAASDVSDGLPLFAGGKSMGGRMTSLAASKGPLSPRHRLLWLSPPSRSPASNEAST